MAIRMTGLNSGLDTEAIVGAMMEAHKAKKTKVDNKKTTLEWKQDIWSGLNKKLYSFYTDYASKMRMQASYKTKKATSSNSSVVTATAKSNAVNGSYSIKVKQLAAAQYVTSADISTHKKETGETDPVTGEKITEDVKTTGKTKLSELGFTGDGSEQISIAVNNGKTINMNINEDTTINDFVQNLKDAGLSASFDEAQGRFFIGASASGAENKFTITSNKLSNDVTGALEGIKNALDYDELSDDNKKIVDRALSDIQNNAGDTDAVAEALDKLYEVLDADAKKVATEYVTNQLKESIKNGYDSEKKDSVKANIEKKYVDTDTDGNKTLNEAGKKALAEILEKNGTDEASLDANEKLDLVVSTKVDEQLDKDAETQAKKDVKKSENQAQIENYIQNGIKEIDDEGNVNIILPKSADRNSQLVTEVDGYVAALQADDGVQKVVTDAEANTKSALVNLGLENIDGDEVKEEDSKGMVVIKAQDSEVQVNGATLKSSNTTLDVNGLTLDLVSASPDETISLTVTNDTSAVYDSVKDFVNQYNSILADLNKYYYASSARGYDPLTDDQKEEMSDDEIEKWETKIKDSLLRRDSTLSGILESMRSSMTGFTVKASNGTTYSLANLGITTGKDYKEYGLLHIKGDEDDTVYADDTNTLQKMIEEDPDTVMEVLSGISGQLYSQLSKKMQSTTMSSALTFYNDKEMKTQLDTYKKDVSEWETKLKDIEDRYYSQFTAMEKAMASLQSQQSALSGYLGL